MIPPKISKALQRFLLPALVIALLLYNLSQQNGTLLSWLAYAAAMLLAVVPVTILHEVAHVVTAGMFGSRLTEIGPGPIARGWEIERPADGNWRSWRRVRHQPARNPRIEVMPRLEDNPTADFWTSASGGGANLLVGCGLAPWITWHSWSEALVQSWSWAWLAELADTTVELVPMTFVVVNMVAGLINLLHAREVRGEASDAMRMRRAWTAMREAQKKI